MATASQGSLRLHLAPRPGSFSVSGDAILVCAYTPDASARQPAAVSTRAAGEVDWREGGAGEIDAQVVIDAQVIVDAQDCLVTQDDCAGCYGCAG